MHVLAGAAAAAAQRAHHSSPLIQLVQLVLRCSAGALALASTGYVVAYLVRLPQVKRHVRPVRAGIALLLAIAALLAAVWSRPVAAAVGDFVLSPGLAALAALGAASLALYGVVRQVTARAEQDRSDEERDRAAKYAEHLRWVSDRVFQSTSAVDTPLVVHLVRDLYLRAPTERDRDFALRLAELHRARLRHANVIKPKPWWRR